MSYLFGQITHSFSCSGFHVVSWNTLPTSSLASSMRRISPIVLFRSSRMGWPSLSMLLQKLRLCGVVIQMVVGGALLINATHSRPHRGQQHLDGTGTSWGVVALLRAWHLARQSVEH